MIDILSLKLLAENGDVKFKAYGEEIDVRYNGVYEMGDKWRIELEYCEFIRIKLDETLADHAKRLDSYDTVYYTCHCTGEAQYAFMKPYMRRLNYLSCGDTIEI